MKKLLIPIFLIIISCTMIGCQKKIKLEDNFSEITKIYFQATGEKSIGSICVGQREEPYCIDGSHSKNCDFSLITLKFNEFLNENSINVNLKINDVTSNFELELNPINNTYMGDLGYLLKESDVIVISYKDFLFSFENITDTFNINYKQATEIAIEQFGEELNQFYSKGNFVGECYLKVLTKDSENENNLFWIFTVVGENKVTKNIIISVKDGSILIKN